MAAKYTTETFFRPEEVARQPWSLTAEVYNRCQLLLSRSETGCAFVPIRSSQLMAVIDAEEIIFVDGHGYAVRDGVGGRPILLAWHPAKPQERAALTDAVPCEVVYYKHGLRDVQRQLVGEFAGALKQLDQKYRDTEIPACGAKIISIRASVSD